jgi:acetolactate synthase-1/2/3 large subunit
LRHAFEATQRVLETPGSIQLGKAVRQLSDRLGEDAIITSGAGNFSQFVHRYFTYTGFGTSLAPASGTMGYGLPAAIAAKIAEPQRTVIAFAGDGCFMMTAQELATAVQYGVNMIVIVADNGMYGTIRMHQERAFPGRVSGTSLINPDFAALARSFGANAQTITTNDAFDLALEEALTSPGIHVLTLKLDPEAITPQKTLAQIATAQT